MNIDPDNFINAGTDDYYHVYVYEMDFADGSLLDYNHGRLLILDVDDFYPWADDADEREEFDETGFLAAIKAKLEADYAKPLASFAFQLMGQVDDGVTIDAATLQEAD